MKRGGGSQTETLIKYEWSGRDGWIKAREKDDGHEIFPGSQVHRAFTRLGGMPRIGKLPDGYQPRSFTVFGSTFLRLLISAATVTNQFLYPITNTYYRNAFMCVKYTRSLKKKTKIIFDRLFNLLKYFKF